MTTPQMTQPQSENLSAGKYHHNWLRRLLLDWDKTQLAASFLIIFLIGLSPLLVESPYYMGIIVLTVLYAYIGLAWNIVGGFAGQLLIGHISFFAFGAYTTIALLNHFNISPWIGIPAAMIPAGLLGALIAFLTLRYGLKLDYFALFTLALMVVLGIIFSKIPFLGGAIGMWIPFRGESFTQMAFVSKVPYLYISLLLLIIGVVVHYWVYRSKLGKYMVAIREDEAAAAALGVNVGRYKTIAVVLTAALSGMGGGFYVVYTTFVEPPLVFGMPFNVELLVAPIIGGRGTIIGPILGALLNKPVVELFRGWFAAERAGTTLIIYGSFLMFFMLFLPRGVAGLLEKPYRKLRTRLLGKSEDGKE
ncbi:MAG: branched-chain amino acid ABC transporter permease [Chloroflexota bacterium]